jgi:hypothetical protein
MHTYGHDDACLMGVRVQCMKECACAVYECACTCAAYYKYGTYIQTRHTDMNVYALSCPVRTRAHVSSCLNSPLFCYARSWRVEGCAGCRQDRELETDCEK